MTNYTCQNEHGAESARSFPSGHSLFAILLFSAMGNLLQVTTSGKDKVLDPTWASRLMAQVCGEVAGITLRGFLAPANILSYWPLSEL